MYELAYYSLINPKAGYLDVLDILEESREYNAKHNITGCLLYHNNYFAQVLEGEKRKVQNLFKLICEDNRHKNVVTLHKGTSQERVFENWNMAFQKIESQNLSDYHNDLFEKNLLTFAQLADQPSPATNLFWRKVREIVIAKSVLK